MYPNGLSKIKTHMLLRLFLLVFLLVFGSAVGAQDSVTSLVKSSQTLFSAGKYQEALGSALRALSMAEKDQNPRLLIKANMQVGTMYYYNEQSNKKKILPYYYKVKELAEKYHFDTILSRVYHNIGVCYIEEKNADSGEYYMRKAITAIRAIADFKRLSKSYAVLMELYKLRIADTAKIMPTVKEAYRYARMSGDSEQVAFSLMKFGFYYYDQKMFRRSLPYFYRAKNIYSALHDLQGLSYATRNIANAYGSSYGVDTKKAYDEYLRVYDSLFSRESAEKVAKYETLYKTEKKERENEDLQQANILKEKELNARNFAIVALVILILLIIVLIFWRLNVINLRKKQQELLAIQRLEDERNRISRDLHDNVGALVSFVNTKIDWVMKNKNPDPGLLEDLGLIKNSSREILEGLRDSIWTLNTPNITNFDLIDKLKPYIKSHLHCEVIINDELQNEAILNNEQVLAVYRCCQEIVNNINKHSAASKVNVAFTEDAPWRLVICIADNGKGISETDLNKQSNYGMRNLKSRLTEVGAVFELQSAATGTTITIKI